MRLKRKLIPVIFFLPAIILFTPMNSFSDSINQAHELQNAFNGVAEKAFPAVVVITTKKAETTVYSPWEFFFEFPQPQTERFWEKRKSTPKIEGRGSGLIVHEDGYILTNYHVVANNDEIIVRLKDQEDFKAEILGTDKKTDLAVLKINANKKLPFLKFADSDKVRIGDWAIAVGAPFDFDYSMTVGIVSQKGRSVGLNVYENYIQTDASINPGNSGGPLLNLEGDVIGINDFIVTANTFTPGNIGLGFAIPSNMAKDVMEQLIHKGKVVRPWIGISMQALSSELKEQFNADSGVLVREVFSGDPADKGGIEPGDIIIEIDGQKVNTPGDVQFAVLKHKPEDKVQITALRNGKKKKLEIVAVQQKTDEMAGFSPSETTGDNISEYGLSLSEENGEIIVSSVAPNSMAEHAGLRRGMKIYAINRVKVKSLADVEQALRKKKDSLLLYISDGRTKRFVILEKD